LNFNSGRLTARVNGAMVSGSGQVQLNGPAYLSTSFAGSTLANLIAGVGSLTKEGAGTLTLSGANTYTGATTVSAGILKAGIASVANTSGALGNNSAVTLANIAGVALDITGYNTQIGSLTGGGGTGGNVTLGGATLTVGGDGTSPPAYAGVISGTSGLTKIGGGTQTLSGANTYGGVTKVNAGTLQFAKKTSLYNNTPASWTAANIVVDSGATLALNVGGTNEFAASDLTTLLNGTHLGASTGTTGLKSGSILGLDTTNAGGGSFTYSTVIANPNSGANVLGLTKRGTGQVVLDQANTYTGPTTVSAGTLLVNGSLASGSTVTVAGGTLGGTGTINGPVIVDLAGTLAPGASIDTLEVGATTLNGTFLVDVDANGTSDLLAVTGNLALGGASILTIVDPLKLVLGKTYTIATYGTRSGTFGGGTNLPAPSPWYVDYGTGSNDKITLTPEPATLALLALGGLALILRRKRR